MAGWVYILSNPAMPGLFKVGYTDRDPFSRAKEISQATGVPFDFIVEYQIYVSHPYELEQKTHKLLHNHRVNNNREFFNCSYEDVVETIRVAINDLYKHIDNFVFGSESSYKTEKEIYESIEEFAYVWYNHVRPHSYNDYMTPYEKRRSFKKVNKEINFN